MNYRYPEFTSILQDLEHLLLTNHIETFATTVKSISLLPSESVESSLSALKLSDDSPLTVKLGAETMEQKKTEHGEHAADKQTSKISIL